MLQSKKDIETILREGGFTIFQKRVVLIAGFAWIFVAMEVILIAFTLPLFQAIWNLNSYQVGLIGSSVLIGSFIGSFVLGRVADRIGRKPVFLASVLWYSIFTGLTALSTGPEVLFAFRLLAGIGLGGMLVVDPTLLSEFLAPQVRGRYMVALDAFWPIGSLFALGLAYYFLGVLHNQWQLLFVAAAFPAFIAAVVRVFIPETPYYLARAGKLDSATKVLSRVSGRDVKTDELWEPPAIERGRYSELFKGAIARSSIVTVVAWAALNFSYYGFFLWLPTVLTAVGKTTIQLSDIYVFLFLSFVAQIPGYLSAMWFVEKIGRKKSLIAYLILGGLSGYIFATAADYTSFIAGLFFVSFFNLGAWGCVYAYTVELFPTRLRGTAFGLAAEGVGKIVALLAPIIFGLLLASTGGLIVPLTVIAASMILGGIVVAIVGKETKGAAFQ